MNWRHRVILSLATLCAVPVAWADGMLDPDFGTGGLVLDELRPGLDRRSRRPGGPARRPGDRRGRRATQPRADFHGGGALPAFGRARPLVRRRWDDDGGVHRSPRAHAGVGQVLLQPDGRIILVGSVSQSPGRAELRARAPERGRIARWLLRDRRQGADAADERSRSRNGRRAAARWPYRGAGHDGSVVGAASLRSRATTPTGRSTGRSGWRGRSRCRCPRRSRAARSRCSRTARSLSLASPVGPSDPRDMASFACCPAARRTLPSTATASSRPTSGPSSSPPRWRCWATGGSRRGLPQHVRWPTSRSCGTCRTARSIRRSARPGSRPRMPVLRSVAGAARPARRQAARGRNAVRLSQRRLPPRALPGRRRARHDVRDRRIPAHGLWRDDREQLFAAALAGPDRILAAGRAMTLSGTDDFGLARYIASTPVEAISFSVE